MSCNKKNENKGKYNLKIYFKDDRAETLSILCGKCVSRNLVNL